MTNNSIEDDADALAERIAQHMLDRWQKLPAEILPWLRDVSGGYGYMSTPVQLGPPTHKFPSPLILQTVVVANGGGIELQIKDWENKTIWRLNLTV
jgi:hypothetical protein